MTKFQSVGRCYSIKRKHQSFTLSCARPDLARHSLAQSTELGTEDCVIAWVAEEHALLFTSMQASKQARRCVADALAPCVDADVSPPSRSGVLELARGAQRRALWPSRCARRGPCNVARAFRVAGNVHTCSTGKVIAVSTFQDSEFPRPKKKERSGSKTQGEQLYQFPRTSCAGHPESRLRASPRILEPGQISRSRYRHAESNLRTSPCDLEIERQNTDSKFRDSSFCLRSCTLTHHSDFIARTSARTAMLKMPVIPARETRSKTVEAMWS